MHITQTFYPKTRAAWRAWLKKNHAAKKEIWLVYYRQAAGKPRISYNDAVEEALCFGWIDSQVKGLDKQRFAQRFTPRRPTSGLSPMNKERLHKLIRQKKMTKAGLEAVAHVFNSAKSKAARFIIPPAILKAIKANPIAWKNFQKLPASYKRIRIAFIESRKRHGQDFYRKALRHFITMTAQNRRFGYVKEMT